MPWKPCERCGMKFYTSPHRLAKGFGKYCSYKCANQTPPLPNNTICIVCGKPYRVAAGKLNTTKFCSRKCKDTPHIPITELKNWATIRKRVFSEYGVVCYKCGWCESYCDVHHLNGNHDDNRLENLRPACPNCHRIETMKQQNWGHGLTRKDTCFAKTGCLRIAED